MPETSDRTGGPPATNDPWFVETVMYHGRSSRRPGLRLLLGLAFGLAVVVGGVLIHADLAAWEAAGQPARTIPAVLLALYETGGKTLVLVLFVAAGLGFAGLAVRGFVADRQVARRQGDGR